MFNGFKQDVAYQSGRDIYGPYARKVSSQNLLRTVQFVEELDKPELLRSLLGGDRLRIGSVSNDFSNYTVPSKGIIIHGFKQRIGLQY